MTTQSEKAARFLELHRPGNPLLLPNPWDQGSARLLASLGFQALATTSSGFAATLGRLDGSVSRGETLAHAATIVAATDLPVSADLENGYADDPADVARTVILAVEAGLAGCSIEDSTGHEDEPIYDSGLAAERVAAAAEAAHAGPVHLVLTARAENYLHGRPDLADTIARLQAYQAAGADVLYAPGLTSLADIRQVVAALDSPVNVLAVADAPPVSELAEADVSRVSVGGAFAFAALGALVDAATELRDKGTYGYLANSKTGREAIQRAVLRRLQNSDDDMAGPFFDAVERSRLCDLLEELGPDAPTLLPPWTTRDIAAHLVLRERDNLAAPGLVLPGAWSRLAERRSKELARQDFAGLVATVRSGPPPGFFRIGWVRRLPSLNEFFVHQEDVRRANGLGPRTNERALDEALWRNVGRGPWYLARRLRGAGLELQWEGTAKTVTARRGDPAVRVTGPPGELLLYLFGRKDAAQVEVSGPAAAVEAVRRARFGV
jgi:uncharacterized protein (TIGR03085 family)